MTFDRNTFMSYVLEGTLLDRDADGNVFVCDHIADDMDAAVRSLDEGGKVTLTMGGKPFSTVELSEDGTHFGERRI